MVLTKTASNGHHTFALTVTETAVSNANNTSTVSFSLVLQPNGYDWYFNPPAAPVNYSITIDGSVYTGVIYEYVANTTLTVRSGSQMVTHNANGKKTISVGFTISSLSGYAFLPGSAEANGTLALTDIPRLPSISQTMTSRTETSLTIKWTSDTVCDYLWYKVDNGSFVGIDIADGTSGTYTITGLSVGAAHAVVTRVRSKASRFTADSTSASYWTYGYPYANDRPTFAIGQSVKIGLANPMNRPVTVSLIVSGTTIAAGTTSGSSITLTPTSTSEMYAAIPNASTGTYTAQVVYSGNTTTRTGSYAVPSSAKPTATSFTYADTFTQTLLVTADDQLIVQNKSKVEFTLAGLSGYQSSTVTAASVATGTSTYSMTISGTSATVSNVIINSSEDVTVTATITDSRGMTNTLTLTVTMLEYSKPTALYTVARRNNYYSETDITVNPQYSSLDGNNTIEVSYQVKKTSDSSFGTWTTMSGTTATAVLDNLYAWNVRLRLRDKFSVVHYPEDVEEDPPIIVPVGTPIFFIDRRLRSIGINCFPKYANSVEADGHDLRKSIITSSLTTDINPASTGNYTKITLDASASFGTRLSAYNGGVKIGEGVSQVTVSARVAWQTTGAGIRYARICKNSYSVDNTIDWVAQTMASGEYWNLVIPPTVVAVSPDDVLYLYYFTSNGDLIIGSTSGKRTSMTIEFVG